jgi:hypothetical protein
LVWLDSCDKHRNEEMKLAAASGLNLSRPRTGDYCRQVLALR